MHGRIGIELKLAAACPAAESGDHDGSFYGIVLHGAYKRHVLFSQMMGSGHIDVAEGLIHDGNHVGPVLIFKSGIVGDGFFLIFRRHFLHCCRAVSFRHPDLRILNGLDEAELRSDLVEILERTAEVPDRFRKSSRPADPDDKQDRGRNRSRPSGQVGPPLRPGHTVPSHEEI